MFSHDYISDWLASVSPQPAGRRDERKRKRAAPDTSSPTGVTTMPTTPPSSTSHLSLRHIADPEHRGESPKRRIQDARQYDFVRTPTASSQSRPVLVPGRRRRPRSASPIKSINNLRQLQKPVHILACEAADALPDDAYGLYRDIRRCLNSAFIPGSIREEFLHAYGRDADLVPKSWFGAEDSEGKDRAALVLRHPTTGTPVEVEEEYGALCVCSSALAACRPHCPRVDIAGAQFGGHNYPFGASYHLKRCAQPNSYCTAHERHANVFLGRGHLGSQN